MASIYKRDGDGPYLITYSIRPRVRKTVTGCHSLEATRAISRKLEDEARQIRRGAIDTKAERLSHSEALPLADHLAAFVGAMQGKGGTENHVKRTEGFVKAIVEACGFETLADLDAAKVSAHVADLKEKGKHARAINARLTAVKSFTRWLFRTERMRTDPMMQVAKLNANADRQHVRRALSDDELARLIAAAQSGAAWTWTQGNGKTGSEYRLKRLTITGPDRAMLYRLAAETGLRAGELASLKPASFSLADVKKASVKVAAAYSKHRRDDLVPLRRDLAEAVAAFINGRPKDAPLFAVPDRTADMIRADLAAARDAWLQESATAEDCYERFGTGFLTSRDTSGHVADFHALRHTFITRLARSGVTPAVAKSLARHSTIMLTMDHYTHTVIGEERAALDRLHTLTPPTTTPEAAKATGTYDSQAVAAETGQRATAPATARSRHQMLKCANTGDDAQGDARAGVRAEAPMNAGNSEHLRLSSYTRGPLAQWIEQGTHNHTLEIHKGEQLTDLQQGDSRRAAPDTARRSEIDPAAGLEGQADTPPELAQVIAAWPDLPEAVKAGIMAMVKAAGGPEGK